MNKILIISFVLLLISLSAVNAVDENSTRINSETYIDNHDDIEIYDNESILQKSINAVNLIFNFIFFSFKANDLTKKYGTPNTFTAKLVDGTGKPQANAKITFNINGVFYTRTTNETGIAKLNINLQQGKYIITSSYNGAKIANTVTVLS